MSDARNLVVGVFDHPAPAEAAVADLWAAGFARDRVDMITHEQGQTQASPSLTEESEATEGAVTGAVTGAAVGAVAGAAAMILLPGIGTVIGGGILAGIVGGAALGATEGTFLGPFVALAMGEDEAHRLAVELREGRTVVLVMAYDRAAEARAILAKHGAKDGRLNQAAVGPVVAVPGKA